MSAGSPQRRGCRQPGARLRPGRRERSSPRRSRWAERYAVRNTTCCELGRPVPRTPSWGSPIRGLTPDRSRIRPKSRPACRRHPSTRAVGAGAPPRLGKGHPSSAARRSDPPLTELAPLSPRGRGADDPHPASERSVACEFPQWVENGHRPPRAERQACADNGLLRARRHPPSRPLTPVVSALSDAAWYDWRSGAEAFREAVWLGPRGRRSAC